MVPIFLTGKNEDILLHPRVKLPIVPSLGLFVIIALIKPKHLSFYIS